MRRPAPRPHGRPAAGDAGLRLGPDDRPAAPLRRATSPSTTSSRCRRPSSPLLRYLRQTVAHAGRTLASAAAGPVHLNAPFRDPLPPVPRTAGRRKLRGRRRLGAASSRTWRPPRAVDAVSPVPDFSADGPWRRSLPGPPSRATRRPMPRRSARSPGSSAGRSSPTGFPRCATTRPRCPISSPATTRSCATGAAADRSGRRSVLCLGGWPTSKVLRGWVEASGAPVFLVTERPDNRDALHGPTRAGRHPPSGVLPRACRPASAPNGYERLWAGHEARARAALDERLAAEEALYRAQGGLAPGPAPAGRDPRVRRQQHAGARHGVRLAGERPRDTGSFFSRGANGIDGTLSTALGVAHGGRPGRPPDGRPRPPPRRNGFLIRPEVQAGASPSSSINNRGGGIFEHLPVAQFGPVFEEFFATPQEVDFARLCAAHGVEHVHVEDWAAFRAAGLEPPAPGRTRPGDRRRPKEGRRLAQGGVCLGGPAGLVPTPLAMSPKWKTVKGLFGHPLPQGRRNRPDDDQQAAQAKRLQAGDHLPAVSTPSRTRATTRGSGVVLLTGAGPHTDGKYAFCAGGDQSVRGSAGYVGSDGVPRLNVLDLQKLIRSMPKVVIALVAGYAIGGGHVLHVVCDLTLAADNAVFGQVGPSMGSFDGGFGSSYLARIVGQKKAREIWFLCRKYDAAEALEMGLVNAVVPVDSLENEGVKWAARDPPEEPARDPAPQERIQRRARRPGRHPGALGKRDAALLHERGGQGVPRGPARQAKARRAQVPLAALTRASPFRRTPGAMDPAP